MPRKPVLILLFLILSVVTGYFRFYGLGYSDFQGDEVSAQNYLFDSQPFLQFLLSRNKAPGQFVVTALVNSAIKPSISSTFLVRLPFAVAGVFSVLILFLILKEAMGLKIAFFASTFLSIFGLFIAFSRIAQYQSFVILFSILNLYALFRFGKSGLNKWLITAGVFSGLGLLFHYDALSFIVPTLIYLILIKRIKSLLYYLIPTVALALVFYVPFIYYNRNRAMVLDYLVNERLFAGYVNETSTKVDSVFYSVKLLEVYTPKEVLATLVLAVVLQVWFVLKFKSKSLSLVMFLVLGLIAARYFAVVKTPLLYFASILSFIAFAFLLYLNVPNKSSSKALVFINTWFLFSFFVYGLVISKPLTHIYTFLIPLIPLVAYQLFASLNTVVVWVIFVVCILSGFSFSYQAFIEHDVSYPLVKEHYIFGNMSSNVVEGAVPFGLFGFPKHVGWEQLLKDILDLEGSGPIASYFSNDGFQRTKYYLDFLKFKDSDFDLYVYIKPVLGQSSDEVVFDTCYRRFDREGYSLYKCL